MITLLKRILKLGWLSFSRDGGSIAANISIMVVAISAITSLFLFKNASQFLISSIQEKVDISVYFKGETQEGEILGVKEKIADIPEVKEVQYVSQDEAFREFVARHKDNQTLMGSLEEVGVNPFLASLNIKAFEASQYQAVADFLESADFDNLIEKIDYYQRKPVIDRIFSLTSNLNKAGIVFSIILIIIAVLVDFNMIRLAIYHYREEIKIQRLVGASNWFIRGPFLVQGAISGFFAILISLAIFALACWIVSPKLEFLFPDFNLFNLFITNFWLVVLIQFATGIILGVISSLIAIRRYLEA